MNTKLSRTVLAFVACVSLLSGCTGSEDACGNTRCEQGQRCDVPTQLCVTEVAPVVSITTPADGAKFAGATLEVTGVVTDDSGGVERAEISTDGASWTALELGADGAFSTSVAVPKLDSEALVIRVRAVDSLQQEGSAEANLVVDNVAPSCAFTGLESGTTFAIADGAVVPLAYGITDGSGVIARAELSTDNGATLVTLEAAPGSSSFDWTLPQEDGVEHVLVLSARDASDNACIASVTVKVDTVAPVVTLSAPVLSGAPHLVGADGEDALTVAGSTSDGGGSVSVSFDFDDAAGPRSPTTQPQPGGFTFVVPLEAEDYVLHEGILSATDPAGNRTQIAVPVTVDRVAPLISFVTPTPGQKFNATHFAAGDDLAVSWISTDGDPNLTATFRILPNPMAAPALMSSGRVFTSSSDDGVTYTVEVVVTDSLNHKTTQQLSFIVDRVFPTVTAVTPANNSRVNEHAFKVTFSEPVTLEPGGITLSPSVSAPGGTNTVHTFPLAPESVYTATISNSAAVDAAGNPSIGASTRSFHTSVKTPASGSQLPYTVDAYLYNHVLFDAASDEDGMVSVALHAAGVGIIYGEFNALTGAFEQRHQLTSGTVHHAAVSAHRDLSGLSAVHRRGYSVWTSGYASPATGTPSSFRGGWISEVSAVTPLATASNVVPVTQGCLDPAGDPVGYISATGVYERVTPTGKYTQATGLAKVSRLGPFSSNTWNVVGVDGAGNAAVTNRHCMCSGVGSGCAFKPVRSTQLVPAMNARWSFASPSTRGLLLFNSGADRMEVCFDACVASLCPMTLPAAVKLSVAENLHVAPANSGHKVLGARKTASGIELRQRDLAVGCAAPWTTLATAPNTSGATITDWRPVMFGPKPGVIYLDGTTLKIWIP